MCFSWLRAVRCPLCSWEYVFSAELCLLNCFLDSLPLHVNVFHLQGQTLFLTDLRRPGGMPSVPESVDCCGEGGGGNRWKDGVTVQEPLVQGPTPRRSKFTETPRLREGRPCSQKPPFQKFFLKGQLPPSSPFIPQPSPLARSSEGQGTRSSLTPSPAPGC